ncbi:MAG TPA: sensor domain-containing phosphodiesterase [Actinomycetales bacterium]|nr:sensor domain-containing phosphodiesterase [Actinomycetales bacterium]
MHDPFASDPDRTVDTAVLLAAVDDIASTVADDVGSLEILRHLLLATTRVLQVDGAGVLVPGGTGGTLQVALASSGPVEELERLQEELQEGPCHATYVSGQPLNLGDVVVEGSWPGYQGAAALLDLHAVATMPLTSRGETFGVMDVYRSATGRFSEAEMAALATLARLASTHLAVDHDRAKASLAQRELARQAMHDPLTGLIVRWVLLEQLQHVLSRMTRHPESIAVLFIDLDGLKYVNDTVGHLAGDALLRTCADRFRAALREGDLLARFGGDEFVVLLERLGHRDEAVAVATRILEELLEPVRIDGRDVQPSVSIGVAVTDDPQATPEALISHADSAMYRAKHIGPGRYAVFDPDVYAADRTRHERRELLLSQLRQALPTDQLEVHYQPIVDESFAFERDGATGTIYAVEALARWRHPSRGLLTASAFVDTAIRSGFITDIGRHLLTAACRQLATWDDLFGAQAPPRLFFNVSPPELTWPGLADAVGRILADQGIAPQRLTIEITENGLFSKPQATARNLDELRDLGAELAIDDFGTGYSSLSRLVEIPARTLKVDQAFTHDLLAHAEARAVVTTVLLLGHNLRRTVVIEGVETGEQRQALLELGATHLQGNYLCAPRSGGALTAALREGWGERVR